MYGVAESREYIRYSTLAEMFNVSAVKHADWRCQWWKTGPDTTDSLSYGEVYLKVKDLTSGLIEMGIEKGDRIAIMASTCPQWLWSDFSILNAGGITVTIYPSFSVNEMQYIINNSTAKILFIRKQDDIGKVNEALNEMPSLEKVIVMEDCPLPNNPKFMHLSELRQRGKVYLRKNPYAYEKRWRSIDVWDPATIVYTSGTTGDPKGALHTHQSVMAANALCQRSFVDDGLEFGDDDTLLSFLPLSHTFERQCGQFIPISLGLTIAYAEKPSTVVQDMQIFKPTVFCSVPRIFERIFITLRQAASQNEPSKAAFEKAMDIGMRVTEARMDENGAVDMREGVDMTEGLPEDLKAEYLWAEQNVFSKVRMMLGGRYRVSWSASASLPANLCKMFMAMGIRIIEGYGSTETCNAVNLNRLAAIKPGCIGPLRDMNEGKIGDNGEWLISCEQLFLGYWNNPEATSSSFTEDGYFHTGDVVEWDVDGNMRLVDRIKGIMVLDTGKNVPRAKIENSFSTSNVIEQICAVADERKYVSAVVVPKFEFFIHYFKTNNIPFDESKLVFAGEGAERICVQVGDDFVSRPELQNMIDADIQKSNEELEAYESIKRYAILNRRFLEANNEVTPTFKLKHRNILKNLAEFIDKIYA